MKEHSPKGELVLLCDKGYLVEKVLYSSLQFDPKEILRKSLISVAHTHSFDAVLQLVSDLRSQGKATDSLIQLVIGDQEFELTFSGTCLHEHVVLTARTATIKANLISDTADSAHHKKGPLSSAELASEDMRIIEKINQFGPESINIKSNRNNTSAGWTGFFE